MGGKAGLSSTPSQRIVSPDSYPNAMFGHALSKGVDIDGNGYNDFAVGSPHAEKVHVFKSYPVVKILLLLSSSKSKIQLEDVIPIKFCFKLKSKIGRDIGEFPLTRNFKCKINMKCF